MNEEGPGGEEMDINEYCPQSGKRWKEWRIWKLVKKEGRERGRKSRERAHVCWDSVAVCFDLEIYNMNPPEGWDLGVPFYRPTIPIPNPMHLPETK